MVVLSLMLPQAVNRWANIIVAVFFFLFNLVGLPTYPSAYDKFLLVVSMGFNVVTVWTRGIGCNAFLNCAACSIMAPCLRPF